MSAKLAASCFILLMGVSMIMFGEKSFYPSLLIGIGAITNGLLHIGDAIKGKT